MKNIEHAEYILRYYYGTVIPRDLLMKIINSDAELLHEVESGGIGDTEQRSDLMQAVIRHLGIQTIPNFLGIPNQWPCFGDSGGYSKSFFKLFLPALLKVDGKCTGVLPWVETH